MRCETAMNNPFVRALRLHRQQLLENPLVPLSGRGASLEQQLATEREALSLLFPCTLNDDDLCAPEGMIFSPRWEAESTQVIQHGIGSLFPHLGVTCCAEATSCKGVPCRAGSKPGREGNRVQMSPRAVVVDIFENPEPPIRIRRPQRCRRPSEMNDDVNVDEKLVSVSWLQVSTDVDKELFDIEAEMPQGWHGLIHPKCN